MVKTQSVTPLDLQMKYKLSPVLAGIFSLLIKQKIVTVDDIVGKLKITDYPRVALYRLRGVVIKDSITIHHHRDVGYWLDDATKARVVEEIKLVLETAPGHSAVTGVEAIPLPDAPEASGTVGEAGTGYTPVPVPAPSFEEDSDT